LACSAFSSLFSPRTFAEVSCNSFCLAAKSFRSFFQILLRSQELLLFFSQVLRQAGRHVGISQKRQLTAEIAVARVFLWKLRSQHWFPFILRVHKNSGVHGNSGRSKELQHGSLQRHVSKGHGDEDDCLLVMLASPSLPPAVCFGATDPGSRASSQAERLSVTCFGDKRAGDGMATRLKNKKAAPRAAF
jgi:hypothetical protein